MKSCFRQNKISSILYRLHGFARQVELTVKIFKAIMHIGHVYHDCFDKIFSFFIHSLYDFALVVQGLCCNT